MDKFKMNVFGSSRIPIKRGSRNIDIVVTGTERR
jgi:hypothetical protein